jgi:hypothetical protein
VARRETLSTGHFIQENAMSKSIWILAALLLAGCGNAERERCQGRYDQIMREGYSADPAESRKAPGDIIAFVSSECSKYLQ